MPENKTWEHRAFYKRRGFVVSMAVLGIVAIIALVFALPFMPCRKPAWVREFAHIVYPALDGKLQIEETRYITRDYVLGKMDPLSFVKESTDAYGDNSRDNVNITIAISSSRKPIPLIVFDMFSALLDGRNCIVGGTEMECLISTLIVASRSSRDYLTGYISFLHVHGYMKREDVFYNPDQILVALRRYAETHPRDFVHALCNIPTLSDIETLKIIQKKVPDIQNVSCGLFMGMGEVRSLPDRFRQPKIRNTTALSVWGLAP